MTNARHEANRRVWDQHNEWWAVTVLSIGWILGLLPRVRAVGWLLAGLLGPTFVVEVGLITMQRWRGVPSHFNFATPFDTAVFSTTGSLVVIIELVIVAVAVWSFVALRGSPSIKWAIRVGLILLVGSQVIGNLIVANGIPKVIDFNTGDFIPAGLELAYKLGAAGSMKVPHALTLHAIQVLPILALLLGRASWTPERRSSSWLLRHWGTQDWSRRSRCRRGAGWPRST